MRIPGRRHLVQSFRWARSRVGRGVVVLGYHRLGDSSCDPFDLSISHGHFVQQLDVLKRTASILTLREAVNALAADRLPPRPVVLTFDDGYADTVTCVRPLLEERGIPATVFVTAGSDGRSFWWDELAQLLTGPIPPQLDLDLGGCRRTWVFGPVEAMPRQPTRSRRRALNDVARALSAVPASEREQHMSNIRQWSGGQRAMTVEHRSLRSEEITRLADSRVIEIGAHTLSHPVLAALPAAEQVREIEGSRKRLTTLIHQPVAAFSYPHGSYSDQTQQAVRQAGFTTAFCSRPDIARPASDRLALPRLWVADHDGPTFERWLKRWLTN